jgi:hypothetical protein
MKYLILASRTARALGEMQKPEKTYTANVKLLQKWCDYDRYIESLPTYPLHSSFPDLPVGTVVEGELKWGNIPVHESGAVARGIVQYLHPISADQEKSSEQPGKGEADNKPSQEIIDASMALVRSGYQMAIDEIREYGSDKFSPDFMNKLLQMSDRDKKKQFNWGVLHKEMEDVKAEAATQQPSHGYSIQQMRECWKTAYRRSSEMEALGNSTSPDLDIYLASLPAHPQEGFTKEQADLIIETMAYLSSGNSINPGSNIHQRLRELF